MDNFLKEVRIMKENKMLEKINDLIEEVLQEAITNSNSFEVDEVKGALTDLLNAKVKLLEYFECQ